ncbi:uncharacterized protein TNCV_2186201 [Trichonephila clavipes]|nr:uncharacterized protein TNCV_2186201 [Trichonephila clavipes]
MLPKPIILLCVSLETQILRVKGSFNLPHWGAERAGNRGILDESTFSEGVCVQIHKLHEISKEVSSQGVGDLFTATSYVKSKSVLLSTAICFIRDSFGKMQEVRALLDGGSTSNFISQQYSSEIKVLGVYWNPKHDCFSFRVKIDLHELNTKRDVLSTIARIYDPLGLFRSCGGEGENLPSKLWMLKIDWTDLLPDTINREWRQFVESLQVVNDININRCIVVGQPEVIELHGFSDASQSAYGAVVYCKSITSDRKILVHLIASKSRVAPTKQNNDSQT